MLCFDRQDVQVNSSDKSANQSHILPADVISVETFGLSRRFGSLLAVDDLNVTIAAGSIFGLLGTNGAGKSTTIKMLTTLLRPTIGTARVAGFDISGRRGKSGEILAMFHRCSQPTEN